MPDEEFRCSGRMVYPFCLRFFFCLEPRGPKPGEVLRVHCHRERDAFGHRVIYFRFRGTNRKEETETGNVAALKAHAPRLVHGPFVRALRIRFGAHEVRKCMNTPLNATSSIFPSPKFPNCDPYFSSILGLFGDFIRVVSTSHDNAGKRKTCRA